MRCRQPGCPGTIVDGYCDVCGMPPGSAPVQPAGQGVRGAKPGPATGACDQPGCPGQIVDGYCDVCGNPAGAAPGAVLGTQPSTVTRTSHELASTALGSARVAPGQGATHRRVVPQRRTTRIGAGLTTVPPAPEVDPLAQVMADPVVPEERRNCPHCGNPVGRARKGASGRTQGFCPHCQSPYSFDPKIEPGELVAGQYQVVGCLAYGGMGWIYLARDKNVNDRFVVLKGLLNTGDADAVLAAQAEKRFLAQVEHPLIVEIYNFVWHDGEAYIVMEYVPGRSLKDLLKQRQAANGGVYDPLPVDWALAYLVEILPAFGYLHSIGLLYCDFKPDNVMQVGDAAKLIDLGGVRRMDDDHSTIYGTVGFQAPEVASRGPSVASDLYTIGRTLVLLCAEFRGYQGAYATSLPPVEELPVLAAHDSLYRLVLKCCAPEPVDRFSSAEELRGQLLGVLREVVGQRSPGAASASSPSPLFEPPSVAADAFDWHQLPQLRPDTSDPQWDWLAKLPTDAHGRLAALAQCPQRTPQVELDTIVTALDAGLPTLVDEAIARMLARDPWEWRAVWMQGAAALVAGDFARAQASFNAVYGQVPGELAPKLALAVACERGGEPGLAEALYAICASTDAAYVTASAFGLSRIRRERGDVRGAREALAMISQTARGYTESRVLRAELLLGPDASLDDLARALDALAAANLDAERYNRYAVDVLSRALPKVRGRRGTAASLIGGVPATERNVRQQLEEAYRDLAGLVTDPSERHALIDQANATRRWSLL